MEAKLLTENRDDSDIHESGLQRRSVEPEAGLELSSRVAINSTTRNLTLKDDSISLLKNLQGRLNTDSPVGGILEAVTNTINISNNNLWRSVFSGSMTPVITSSDSFVTPKEGFIQYENSSVTTATLNFTGYKKDFANTISLQSGEGFLVQYVVMDGKLFLKEVALFEAVPFPNGTLGALVVNNGQTVTLPSGAVYDYSSIDIKLGGTLLIDATLSPELTQIYCTGPFVLNGAITGKRIGNGGTFSRVTGVGEQVNFTVTQSLGGAGQEGNGTAGGSGANGFGGGGGGGSYSPGGNGGSGGAAGGRGADGGRSLGGYGGSGNFTLGNGLVNRTASLGGTNGADGGHGGGSGGGGGGAGSNRKHSSDSAGGNGGSGGGYKGQHGIGLYLYLTGTVSGTGKIDLKGTNGYNGGSNVNQGYNGYGGAGGGGAGGSGGSLIVRDVGNAFNANANTTLTAGKIHVDIGFGTGGSGGTRNYGAGGVAASGSSGVTGSYNVQGI